MHAADLGPVSPDQRTQSAVDLFLIFAGANIVATTLQVGASVGGGLSDLRGCLGHRRLAACSEPCWWRRSPRSGTRLGVPSIIATRAALGMRGARGRSRCCSIVTNFAWIALNNVIAASVVTRAVGTGLDARMTSLALGLAGDGHRRAAGRRPWGVPTASPCP